MFPHKPELVGLFYMEVRLARTHAHPSLGGIPWMVDNNGISTMRKTGEKCFSTLIIHSCSVAHIVSVQLRSKAFLVPSRSSFKGPLPEPVSLSNQHQVCFQTNVTHQTLILSWEMVVSLL